jgi:signal transduction histidine kinase
MENLSTIRQIGEQSPKVLFQYSLTRRQFDYLSPAFGRIWTQDAACLAKHPDRLLQTVLPEDRQSVIRCWHKLLKGDTVEESVVILQEGKQCCLRYNVYPIFDEGHALVAVAGMAEDVTKERQFLDYLAEFGQRKNSVLEMVSHDLRGPLAVVQNLAGLLRENLQSSQQQEQVVHYTEIIESACTSCTNLINDLISEEHLQSAHIDVNKMRVDLNEQIRNVAEFYQKGQFIKQHIVLQLPEAPLIVPLDQIKFSQILNNLLANSIKFTPAGGTIRIEAYAEEEQAVIVHEDNGIGIPERMLPGLFNRQRGQGRTGLNGEESRGLGLWIVRDLVELQGGQISVQSKEQQGTTFTIKMPILED